MHSKSELQALAQMRLEDAVFLFRANRCSSAYYLSGYAVELALKACIAKLIQPDVIPGVAFVKAIYTHRFDDLLSTAGLRPQYECETKADLQFAANWAIASKWTEASRYSFWDPMSAEAMIHAIHDPNHGVFQWVKRHW
jgi:HEPN domain-containing protein